MESILVGSHSIKSSHQTAIITIQTTTAVGNEQDTVKTEHRPGPWRVLAVVDLFCDLDSDGDGVEIVFEIMVRNVLVLVHSGCAGLEISHD